MQKFVPVKELKELQPGDQIRHAVTGEWFLVTRNYGGRVTAVNSADVTNPPEWEVLREEKEV